MKVVEGIESVDPPLDGSVLTIGNFDGVHLAHQRLIAQARSLANDQGVDVIALTFDPHPLTIVAPAKAPATLTPIAQKLKLLERAGVDVTVIATSEPKLLGLEAREFVRDVVWARFHPKHIVEGPSFGFGRHRKGTPELLKQYAGELGSEVHIAEPVTVTLGDNDPVMVSSSLVRRLLTEGNVQAVTTCLGRVYSLTANVVAGDRRGRELGFPTANLGSVEQLVPAEGVYAGTACVEGTKHACAISIGHAPTFGDSPQRVEAHLLDFDGDLYGKPIDVGFERYLRGQIVFDSPEALQQQLRLDVEAVRTWAAQTSDTSEAGT